MLAAVPLVLVLPAAFIDQIPLTVTIGIVIIGFIGVGVVILQTPKGQSPVKWFPAYVERRIKSSELFLKPRDDTQYKRSDVTYLSVFYTANTIAEENDTVFNDEKVDKLVSEVENAEKLDRPGATKQRDTQ